MSEKEMENIVKEYLKDVKKALPDWLKDKKEHKEILPDLEEHIWQKAEELSDIGHPTGDSVQLAIAHMGTPKSIAKEYKRRGTPKVYITKEMWPLYKKVLIIVFSVIIGISIFSQLISAIFEDVAIDEIADNIIMGIQNGILASFAIITIVFVALSMEGYFPEDFKSKKEIEKEKRQRGVTYEKELPYRLEAEKELKPFIKPAGEIIGGLFIIGFGFFLLIQPILGLTNLIDPEFLLLVRLGSLFLIAEGTLDLSRGLIGNRQPETHRVIHIITIFVKLSSVSIVMLIMSRPEIFPIIVTDEPTDTFINIGVAAEFYGLFRGIAALVIFIIIISTLEDFIKIYKVDKYKIKV